MENVLSFALGLSASPFVRGMNEAGGATKNFMGTAARLTGVATLITGAFEGLKQSVNLVQGVMNTFAEGAALQQLHARTGQSVADLFLLQHGFRAVGLDANQVGGMIFHLQKSLTGMSELGENTGLAFSELGLSIANLRKLSASQQFEAIAKALHGLNPSAAAAVTSKIFGRESAANFVQLANSTKQWAEAMNENGEAAKKMQRDAAAFQKIELAIDHLKEKSKNIFIGIAEGAEPAIRNILEMLNKIDFSKIGDQIGIIFAAFTESFSEGTLSETIADAITTGFQMAVDLCPGILAKIGETLLRVMQTPMNYIQAGMEWLFQKTDEWAGQLQSFFKDHPTLFKAVVGREAKTDLIGYKSQSYQDIYNERQKEGVKFNVGTGEFGMDDIKSAADAAIKSGTEKSSATWAKFMERMGAIAKRLPGYLGNEPLGKSGGDSVDKGRDIAPASKGFEPTAFEKQGFVFASGGPSSIGNHQQKIAASTAETAKNTGIIAAAILGKNNGSGSKLETFASTVF